jgi:hypothetical protein
LLGITEFCLLMDFMPIGTCCYSLVVYILSAKCRQGMGS